MNTNDGQLSCAHRTASTDELERMRCHVLWAYQRGEPVVLWANTGAISLLPDSLPKAGFIILYKQVGYVQPIVCELKANSVD